jgi:hypothetical protein
MEKVTFYYKGCLIEVTALVGFAVFLKHISELKLMSTCQVFIMIREVRLCNLYYVLIHVVQTNIKYLCTVSCNILYTTKTKSSRYVPILVIDKIQTQLKIEWRSDQLKIDWRSDHFYCIKTQQTTSYYKYIHFTQLEVSLIFNCQKSLQSLHQSIKDILKLQTDSYMYTYIIYNNEELNRYMYKHATYNTDIFFIL